MIDEKEGFGENNNQQIFASESFGVTKKSRYSAAMVKREGF